MTKIDVEEIFSAVKLLKTIGKTDHKGAHMIKIGVEEIFKAVELLKTINSLDLMDIEFCSEGEPINIDPKIKEEWWTPPCPGKDVVGFITSNYYLKKVDNE